MAHYEETGEARLRGGVAAAPAVASIPTASAGGGGRGLEHHMGAAMQFTRSREDGAHHATLSTATGARRCGSSAGGRCQGWWGYGTSQVQCGAQGGAG
jgi:hypothetical protein